MATITEVRQAVSDVLSAAGIRCEPWVPEVPVPPCVIVYPDGVEFDAAFDRGLDSILLKLRVVTQWVSGRASQDELDTYLSGSGDVSIRQIVAANSDLDLANTSARVVRVTDYGSWFDTAGVAYGSAVVEVEVLTEGTT
jgi:hypothetical protein